MQFERNLKEIGQNSLSITIPADLVKYLDFKPNDIVVIQDDKGKYGKFVSIWKKDE